MSDPSVVIIDYGVGNLLSVRGAFEHVGASASISSDADLIMAADRVVLPGVGAFARAMDALDRRGLTDVVASLAAKGTPLLGICLGMQMLLDESSEFGTTAGLGLIPGHVEAIPTIGTDGQDLKVPHIGWTALVPATSPARWQGSVLESSNPGDEVYFVHSFRAVPADFRHLVANGLYGGSTIAAVIRRDNIHGCQFHPEKSGEAGLRMLRQFMVL